MINLTPIPKKIQERLKEKMSVLGRENTVSSGETVDTKRLKLEDMMTRTTFIRMSSNQQFPVILMGGKVNEDGSMPSGYEDIYGTRTYSQGGKEDTAEYTVRTDKAGGKHTQKIGGEVGKAGRPVFLANSLKRPTPGVKGIDVSFKGGERALREATINWTCWDWDELDELAQDEIDCEEDGLFPQATSMRTVC